MAWNILSFELVLFVSVLTLYMKLRKGNIFSLKLVRGLITYVPPVDQDFEVLEKSNQPGRQNKKGEVNKYDKKKLASKAKFPLRTIEIDETFLKHNQEFFIEYDFFFMLFIVVLVLFIITQTLKFIVPQQMDGNLTFYMMMFLLLMTQVNLMKNTFNLGYFNFTDETKMEFLVAIKTFFVVLGLLKFNGSQAFFDSNIEKAHDKSLERVNQTLELLGGRLDLPHEFSYSLLAAFAALISFCTVRLSIRFSYYFFMLTKNRQIVMATKKGDELRRYKVLLYSMFVNLLSPLIVTLFYVKPLLEAFIVPEYLEESTWRVLRVGVVVTAICMRILTYREELQFLFNESYFLVQKLMIDKNEKIFRYIKLRIQENFLNTWYLVFQQTCNLIHPMLLLLIYVHRLVSFITSDQSSQRLDYASIYKRISEEQNKAQLNGQKFEYNIFQDTASLSEMFTQISQKGLLTLEYYEAIFGFMIFWYFFSTLIVTFFSLLYYRKYVEK
eukprot:403335847